MARSATETARILTELYDERFGGAECMPYRMSWAELRDIAGVKRLTSDFLQEINETLHEDEYLLAVGSNSLVVALERDCLADRTISQRLVEQHRYVSCEEPEDIEVDDDVDDPLVEDEEKE